MFNLFSPKIYPLQNNFHRPFMIYFNFFGGGGGGYISKNIAVYTVQRFVGVEKLTPHTSSNLAYLHP